MDLEVNRITAEGPEILLAGGRLEGELAARRGDVGIGEQRPAPAELRRAGSKSSYRHVRRLDPDVDGLITLICT